MSFTRAPDRSAARIARSTAFCIAASPSSVARMISMYFTVLSPSGCPSGPPFGPVTPRSNGNTRRSTPHRDFFRGFRGTHGVPVVAVHGRGPVGRAARPFAGGSVRDLRRHDHHRRFRVHFVCVTATMSFLGRRRSIVMA